MLRLGGLQLQKCRVESWLTAYRITLSIALYALQLEEAVPGGSLLPWKVLQVVPPVYRELLALIAG